MICKYYNCSSLSSVIIPESVTTIDRYAFRGCSNLTSITIPENVTTIGDFAFYNCTCLTSVISKIEEPFVFGNSPFGGVSDDCVLTVPFGTHEAYIAAGWTTDVFKGGIVEITSTNITMSANGISTFCCNKDLDFSGVSGLKAYIVSGFSPSTSKLTLTPVTEVPAGEGLLLQGAEGSYEVPYTTTDMYYSNLLTGVTTTTNISPTADDQTNFILSNGKHGIGFYTIDETGPLAAGKAYLHLPTSAVSALVRCFSFDFDNEEATGIVELEGEAADAECCFDLQGRRVLRPSKGIYIVKGKKVFIK